MASFASLSAVAAAAVVADVPATAAPRPPAHTSRPQGLTEAVSYARAHGARTGIAITDLTTGQHWTAGSTSTFGAASIVKVLIAAKVLYTHQMTGALASLAYRMITESDDQAATELWKKFGGSNIVTDVGQHYGIVIGTPNRRPGYWGNTQVTASGITAFYDHAAADPTVWPWLSNALAHTARLAADGTNQYAFGIPAAGAGHEVKQGWGTLSAGNGYSSKSVLNTTGIVHSGGDTYAIAILTDGSNNSYANARGYNDKLATVLTRETRLLLPHGRFDNPARHNPVVVIDSAHETVRHNGTVTLSVTFDAYDTDAPSFPLTYRLSDNAKSFAVHGATDITVASFNARHHLTGPHRATAAVTLPRPVSTATVTVANLGEGTSPTTERHTVRRSAASSPPTTSPPTSPTSPPTTAPSTTTPTSTGPATPPSNAPTSSSSTPPTEANDCGGQALTKPDGTPWICTFDDEFNGTSLDTSKWAPLTTASSGFRNGPECYVDNPATISESGGTLNLTARELATPTTCTDTHGAFTTSYESGSVDSLSKFTQTYGRVDIRAKFPAATVKGLQSSLWMWPSNEATYGTSSGEIDIAEEYSQYPDRAIPTLHYVPTGTLSYATGYGKTGTNVTTNDYCTLGNVNAFHNYTLIWTAQSITVQYDGRTCLTDYVQSNLGTSAPFDVPFFIVLTQALGIGTNAFDAATTPLPATTSIDYVRAWS